MRRAPLPPAIPCPNCRETIVITLRDLLYADSVTCPGCGTVLERRKPARRAARRKELRETLDAGAAPEAVALLRGLVDRIEIRPAGRGRPPEITLYGRLAELLATPIRVLGPFQTGRTAVAGERYRRYAGSALPLLPIAC